MMVHSVDSPPSVHLDFGVGTKQSDAHIEEIAEACRSYFAHNPYDAWFKRLDFLIQETSAIVLYTDKSCDPLGSGSVRNRIKMGSAS